MIGMYKYKKDIYNNTNEFQGNNTASKHEIPFHINSILLYL